MDTNQKTVFEVVGCVESMKNLLKKELYVVKIISSATGSTIFKLNEVADDEKQESFLFEQKAVHFTSQDVYCNGFLSDDKNNVGTVQIKFKPQAYCCP